MRVAGGDLGLITARRLHAKSRPNWREAMRHPNVRKVSWHDQVGDAVAGSAKKKPQNEEGCFAALCMTAEEQMAD
jgi:hypothetical protein